MRIRASLIKNGHLADHYDFDIHSDEDFLHAVPAAYAHFKANHPGASLFEAGVQVMFARE